MEKLTYEEFLAVVVAIAVEINRKEERLKATKSIAHLTDVKSQLKYITTLRSAEQKLSDNFYFDTEKS